jgi:ABC-type polysaccharide/polyol phosphate export permease
MISTITRYLRIAFKYRFELVVDAGYLIAWMIALGFIGFVFLGKSEILPYEFQVFILINIFFWAFMEKGYLEATRVIPEEARMGTIGTLMNNNVSPLTLIIGQMTARSIINTIVAIVVFIPVFYYLRMEDMIVTPELNNMIYLVVIMVISWLYMMTIAILMGSLALMFKKIGSTAGVFLQILKVGSGFFFPVQAFANVNFPLMDLLPNLLRVVPITRGLEVVRKVIILGELPGREDAFIKALGPLDPIIFMLLGLAVGIVISLRFYRYVERRSISLGVTEQY